MLSSTVFKVVHELPGTERVLTGIDGDQRLNVTYSGTASLRTVAQELLRSASLRTYFVDGRPPTEIRVVKSSASQAPLEY